MPKKTTESEIKELIREITNPKSPLSLKGIDYLADPLLAGIIKCYQSPHDFFNSLSITRRKTSSQMAGKRSVRFEDDGDENKHSDNVTHTQSSLVTRSHAASQNITRSPPPPPITQPPIPL